MILEILNLVRFSLLTGTRLVNISSAWLPIFMRQDPLIRLVWISTTIILFIPSCWNIIPNTWSSWTDNQILTSNSYIHRHNLFLLLILIFIKTWSTSLHYFFFLPENTWNLQIWVRKSSTRIVIFWWEVKFIFSEVSWKILDSRTVRFKSTRSLLSLTNV